MIKCGGGATEENHSEGRDQQREERRTFLQPCIALHNIHTSHYKRAASATVLLTTKNKHIPFLGRTNGSCVNVCYWVKWLAAPSSRGIDDSIERNKFQDWSEKMKTLYLCVLISRYSLRGYTASK
jgi:hypothetical protein